MRILLTFLLICSTMVGQELRRGVVGTGAARLTTGTTALRGTVGQAAIGRVADGTSRHAIGFWYRSSTGGTTVVVPNREAEIGSTTTVQILLTSSKGLVTYGPRSFIIKLRYNATVLVNKSSFPCERDGDDCILTITGTVRDTAAVLAEIPFLVTLGNAERTPLILDSVEWVGASSIVTDKRDGTFQALGVCKDGDSVRLITRGPAAGITGMYPMPATSIATAKTVLIERGPTRMIIIDAIGKEIATVLDDPDARPGQYDVDLNVSEIASGSYYLVLMTPNEMFSLPFMIRK
jgi:hypothetical protein